MGGGASGEMQGGGSFHEAGCMRIDGQVGTGMQTAVAFDEAVAPAGGFEPRAIEGAVTAKNGAKEAVEEKKADAEVGVHAAIVVDRVMVNVVEAASVQEPRPEKRVAGHPEIGEMHAVVQVAEHESRPGDEGEKGKGLIKGGQMKQMHGGPKNRQNESGRSEPFEANVTDGKAGAGGVMVVTVAHGLAGTVDQEVMNEMAAAEEADFVAMQEAVKPVAEEFGEQAGKAERHGDGGDAKEKLGKRHKAP